MCHASFLFPPIRIIPGGRNAFKRGKPIVPAMKVYSA
jgi:hypothetical protein